MLQLLDEVGQTTWWVGQLPGRMEQLPGGVGQLLGMWDNYLIGGTITWWDGAAV